MFKHISSFLAGAGMLGDTVLPLLAGDHIAWLRWRIPIILCAVVALVGLAVQLLLQHREDKTQRAEQLERDLKLPEIIASTIAKHFAEHAKNRTSSVVEEKTNSADKIVLSPHAQLKMAQESVFV